MYWVDHLEEGLCEDTDHGRHDGGSVDGFLWGNYWLEGLGILECVSEGITGILRLDNLVQVKYCS